MESQMTSLWLTKRDILCCLVLLLLLSISSPSLAQLEDKRDEIIHQLMAIRDRTHTFELAVKKWEYNSTLIIVIVMTVGTMGIAVSILQGFGTPLCKIACILLGGLVGVLTLVNTTYFPADHRTYGYNALKASAVLTSLRVLAPGDLHLMTEQVLQARVDQGIRLIKRMEDLEESIYRAWATQGKGPGGVELFPYAYAQKVPDVKQQGLRGVFTGIGESTSLSEARTTALTLAIGQAAGELATTWSQNTRDRVDPYAVRPFIEKVMDIIDENVTEGPPNIIRSKVTIQVPAEFSRDHWSSSFGSSPQPELLRSGDYVLLGLRPPEEFRKVPTSQSSQYIGIVAGKVEEVLSPRAASVQLIGEKGSMAIDNGSQVHILVGTRNDSVGEQCSFLEGPGGSVIVGQVANKVEFRLRRIDGPSREKPPSLVSALRDGDTVRLSIGDRVFTSRGNQFWLGGAPGTALTITRVPRLAYGYKYR